MENIAIYGGAFNPPTVGHKQVITKLLTTNKVDKIIFSPDGDRLDKNYEIDRCKRIKMLKIFFDAIKDEGYNVEMEDYFLTRSPGKTTTMEVEKYFISKLGFQPFHLFGIDTINSMPNWSGNIDRYIQDKLKKIFILRKGFSLPEKINMQNYDLLDLDILEISSTTVREMIKNKLKVNHILTSEVYDFIQENNLYFN